jgi:hypothetical protein
MQHGRQDESIPAESADKAHVLAGEETPEAKPFWDALPSPKPLVAFETPPANVAPPVTWGSSSS